jgi:hypothetical protein
MALRSLALALLASLGSGAFADDMPVIVHLADGTSVPLGSWTLSYEYLAWPQGTPQAEAAPARREARELWVGKRRLPASAFTLELEYGKAGDAQVVKELELKPAQGKDSELKPEAPHRELLMPGSDKKTLLAARSMDLFGQTLTGTRREFCLVSYSVLVQCGSDPADQVVKVEFP